MKNNLLLFIIFSMIAFAIGKLILEYKETVGNPTKKGYHLVKICPPAFYRIVFWSQLKNRSACKKEELFVTTNNQTAVEQKNWLKREIFFEGNIINTAKCFKHFYTIVTNRNGQFWVKKEGTLKPEMHLHILPEYHFGDIQLVYDVPTTVPLDTLFEFGNNNRFVLNYLKTFEMKQQAIKSMNSSDTSNLFISVICQPLINECKNKMLTGQKMENEDAILLGIFWKYLESTKDHLFKQLKSYIYCGNTNLKLIYEFCQIDKQYLLSHPILVKELQGIALATSFCDTWPAAHRLSVQCTQPTIVLEAFCHWLYRSNDPADSEGNQIANICKQSNNNGNDNAFTAEMQQIVKFWMEVLSEKNKFHQWCQTHYTDLIRNIEVLFAYAKKSGNLTTATLNNVDGVYNLIVQFCSGFAHNNSNYIYVQVLSSLEKVLCANGKLQLSNIVQKTTAQANAGSSSNSTFQTTEEPTCCAICREGKVESAFVPCGHCICNNCATNPKLGKRCPICRGNIRGQMRIFLP